MKAGRSCRAGWASTRCLLSVTDSTWESTTWTILSGTVIETAARRIAVLTDQPAPGTAFLTAEDVGGITMVCACDFESPWAARDSSCTLSTITRRRWPWLQLVEEGGRFFDGGLQICCRVGRIRSFETVGERVLNLSVRKLYFSAVA